MIKTLYTTRMGEFGLQTPSREERDAGSNVEKGRGEGSEREAPADTPGGGNNGADDAGDNEGDESSNKKTSNRLRIEDLKPSGSDSLGDFFFGDGEMDPLSMDFERGNSVGFTVDTCLLYTSRCV